MHAHEVHTCEAHTYEVHALEMHARKVLGSPTLQMVVRWSICRDLSCKIRVFALRDKRSLAEEFIYLLPNRPPFSLLPLLCHQVREIQVSPSRMQIHIPSPYNLRLKPELVGNI